MTVPPYERPVDLPEYDRPPVSEVSIGIQMQGLPLQVTQIGLLWARFKDRYPQVEERPPLPPQLELFGQVPTQLFQFQLLDVPPVPMVAFIASDRASLVQVQRDRFQCAWRRAAQDSPYPRYVKFRDDFTRDLGVFTAFFSEQDVMPLPVIQAEITYVNDIPASAHDATKILRIGQLPGFEEVGLGPPESLRAAVSFRFENQGADATPYARLHMATEPLQAPSGEWLLRLALTYRGEPFNREGRSPEPTSAIIEFLDEGHERIVRAFAGATTDEMHSKWGRTR
jgi:uncharacterized protein (TIGR04255 family)